MKLTRFVIGLILLCVTNGNAQINPDKTKSTIAVIGESLVYATPDKIIITFGIETKDRAIQIARELNGAIVRKAIEAIKSYGVQEKDIQTDHLSIEPRWKDDHVETGFVGYFARNTLVVTVNDAERLDGLVASVLETGVNYLHGIDFQTTKFKEYREQARDMALKAAKEKAEKMAAALGQSIGPAIQVSEEREYSPWSYRSSWYGWDDNSRGMNQNVMVDFSNSSGEIVEEIALGKIAIRAGVSVTFRLVE